MKKTFKGSIMLNPVPVVLVTSRNKEGKENVFTVAWVGTVCTRPPMLSISIRPERLSYEYIKESMEFVVNLPSQALVKAVDYCGVRSGKKEDKIKAMNFHMSPGVETSVSSIDECPVSIECRVSQIIPLGSHDMFVAEILACHVEDQLMDEKNKICFEKADLINYSHGEYFPMQKRPIGNFGFSVRKKQKNKKKLAFKKKKY